MTAQHTPGRMHVGEINHKRQRAEIDSKTPDPRLKYRTWRGLACTYGCEDLPDIGSEIMAANVRRFAACWNACEGISTEELENGAIGAMLNALKACNEAMSYMSEYDIPIALPGTVKEAIARVEGIAL